MTELWAVHIVGPDDLIAMPSKEVAESEAAALNIEFAYLPSGDPYPHVYASAMRWPHSAEAHADELHRNPVPVTWDGQEAR